MHAIVLDLCKMKIISTTRESNKKRVLFLDVHIHFLAAVSTKDLNRTIQNACGLTMS